MSISTDSCELLILRQTIFTKSSQLEIFVSCWKESHLVIQKVLKFFMIYCLSSKQKILVLSYST